MSVYRQVHTTFWQDPDVLGWTPEEKYFYLYLLTNTKTRQCGIYEIPLKIMVLETGYNDETIIKLIRRFEDYGKIKYSRETHEIALINWSKYNPASGPKTQACVEKELKSVKNRALIPLVYPIEGASQKEEEQTKEQTKEQTGGHNSERSESALGNDDQPYQLATLLYTEHQKLDPKYLAGKDVEKTIKGWSNDVEKLIRIDKRDPDEIRKVIMWCQTPGCFWASNILSGNKLREKFDTLVMQMARPTSGGFSKPSGIDHSKSNSYEEEWKREHAERLQSQTPAQNQARQAPPGQNQDFDDGLF